MERKISADKSNNNANNGNQQPNGEKTANKQQQPPQQAVHAQTATKSTTTQVIPNKAVAVSVSERGKAETMKKNVPPVDDTNVNIWDEKEGDPERVIFEKEVDKSSGLNYIRAGTLNQLLIRLTHEKSSDMNFLKAFINTYRSFTTPETLLNKLLQRFAVPPTYRQDLSEEQRNKIQQVIQVRVINALRQWIELRFGDLTAPIIRQILSFSQEATTKHPQLSRSLTLLLKKKIVCTLHPKNSHLF